MTPARSHLLVVVVASLLASGCTRAVAPPQTVPAAHDVFAGTTRRAQWLMGTTLIIAVEVPRGGDGDALFAEAFAVVRRLDQLLSAYRRDSALSRLSQQAGRGPTTVASRLYRFLRHSQRLSALTGGAFDIALGALSSVYRAHRGDPPQAALARARACSGRHQLRLYPPDRAQLHSACARLDSGAVGKGYAVDAIVRRLRRRGVRRAFINFGGSTFYGLGHPVGARGWPVLLAGADAAHPLGLVRLRDQALSTSHSLPLRDDGTVGAPHIIDGRSGLPVRQQRFAAVIAPSATDTDALSTALIVEPALRARLQQQPGVRCVTHAAQLRTVVGEAIPADRLLSAMRTSP